MQLAGDLKMKNEQRGRVGAPWQRDQRLTSEPEGRAGLSRSDCVGFGSLCPGGSLLGLFRILEGRDDCYRHFTEVKTEAYGGYATSCQRGAEPRFEYRPNCFRRRALCATLQCLCFTVLSSSPDIFLIFNKRLLST